MKPLFLKNFTPGASKYQNKKIEIDGILFDSKKEAKVYSELVLMKQAGEIADFSRQVVFELVPAQYEAVTEKKSKCVEKAVTYKADFVVEHQDGERSVIDAKGMRTPIYIIKRKLMRYIHKISIKEV
jgi:hypothetical protein